jgi:hypothetical protein
VDWHRKVPGLKRVGLRHFKQSARSQPLNDPEKRGLDCIAWLGDRLIEWNARTRTL